MPKRSDKHMLMRREQILQAATRLFLDKGIHQTSMRDICVESGLSTGAVYTHFPSKQDLILDHAEQALAAKESLSFDTLADFRQHMLSLLLNQSAEFQQLLSLDIQLIEEGLRDDKIRALSAKAIRSLVESNRQCMQALLERGEINPDYDIDVGARSLVALMFSATIFNLLKAGKNPLDFSACVEMEFSRMQNGEAVHR